MSCRRASVVLSLLYHWRTYPLVSSFQHHPNPCPPPAADFRFVEPYGVAYWAHAARAWITHGSLTAPLGVKATLMYGFAAPDARAWVMAGSAPGVVAEAAASGAWTGYLFGLVQVCLLMLMLFVCLLMLCCLGLCVDVVCWCVCFAFLGVFACLRVFVCARILRLA